ncbi:hypothetical protein [Adhaeretor mobilis]|uniref:PEP-CTERM protein-sorting domain-containing protein n=1 Tax=Adhaeretor mobilis TaxID=1930276 RepID=A0A517MS14_9BACT|nr:hypothetical protein [Adhaeretor mobilis]QDS97664.1 hypothetical protein HG15A2_09280 [Adhaeretor mobilis]
MNSQIKLLASLLILSVACPMASSRACTMPLPDPGPSNEYELEIEYEDYDFDTNKVRYKIELEVEVHAPASTAQCQCSLNLGSSSSLAPSSFEVLGAVVGLRTDEENIDLIPFAGFVRDGIVESEVASLANFNAGATPFGFSLDVDPFTAPTVGVGETLALIFDIEFDLDQYSEVNGSPIQFGAGSNEPGHPLNLFSGYQANLQLPALSTLPDADFDSDGDIDGGDFLALQRGFGISEGARLSDGDADHDLEVDDDDLKIWGELYGTGGIGVAATQVPEPASVMLVASAIAGGLLYRPRK